MSAKRVAWNKKEHPRLLCVICGASFTVKAYRAQTAKACSASCRQKYNAQQQTGNATRYSGEGKTYIKMKGRHMHRVVAEQMLGRPLRSGEVVHHKDGDKRNNSPDNLAVIASQGEHMKMHREEMMQSRREKHGY